MQETWSFSEDGENFNKAGYSTRTGAIIAGAELGLESFYVGKGRLPIDLSNYLDVYNILEDAQAASEDWDTKSNTFDPDEEQLNYLAQKLKDAVDEWFEENPSLKPTWFIVDEPEEVCTYGELVSLALDKEITVDKAAQLLGVSIEEFLSDMQEAKTKYQGRK